MILSVTFIPLILDIKQKDYFKLLNPTLIALCVFSLFIQKWQNADLNGKFKLPTKNEFIPTNFEILSLEKEATPYPSLIKVTCWNG